MICKDCGKDFSSVNPHGGNSAKYCLVCRCKRMGQNNIKSKQVAKEKRRQARLNGTVQ